MLTCVCFLLQFNFAGMPCVIWCVILQLNGLYLIFNYVLFKDNFDFNQFAASYRYSHQYFSFRTQLRITYPRTEKTPRQLGDPKPGLLLNCHFALLVCATSAIAPLSAFTAEMASKSWNRCMNWSYAKLNSLYAHMNAPFIARTTKYLLRYFINCS